MKTIFPESSHYLLVEEMIVGEEISQMLFLLKYFYKKNVLDTTLQKFLLEFGEVHDVFVGKFKKQYNDISNGKQQMVSSLRTTVERKTYNELNEADPNEKSLDSEFR